MKSRIIGWFRNIDVWDIILFALPLIICIVALLAYYPGIMTIDSIDQWNQIHMNSYTTWHPIFHTFIELLCTLVWDSPASIVLLQILVISIIWAICCKDLRCKRNFIGILQTIVTIIIFLIPMNFMYAITLWKDILYSYFLLAFSVYILKNIIGKKKDIFRLSNVIIGIILLVFIMKIRYNGLIVTGIVMGALFIVLIIQKEYKNLIKIGAVFLIVLIIASIPERLVNIGVEKQIYKLGPYLHITGALVKNDKITNLEELTVVNSIMPLELWKEKYTPFTHNPIIFNSGVIDEKVLFSNQEKLKEIVIKNAIKHPVTIFRHYVSLTSVIWSITPFEGAYTYVLSTDRPEAFPVDTNTKISNLKMSVDKIVHKLEDNKISNLLLYRPALYLYLSIGICMLVVALSKEKKYFLVIFPMILNSISLLPAIPAQDIRYLYINNLTFYMVLILLIQRMYMKFNKNKRQLGGE